MKSFIDTEGNRHEVRLDHSTLKRIKSVTGVGLSPSKLDEWMDVVFLLDILPIISGCELEHIQGREAFEGYIAAVQEALSDFFHRFGMDGMLEIRTTNSRTNSSGSTSTSSLDSSESTPAR